MKKLKYRVLVTGMLLSHLIYAQEKPVYNSLFWEISGNGLKKPSYLYGTMHVSDRVAFHLSDSFFVALKSADVVALESNPETWMTEMYDVETAFNPNSMGMSMYSEILGMYGFDVSAFNLNEPTYEAFAAAMRYKPQPANHILYRGSVYNENFEEDTYLDMFIYQCGRKLKKNVVNLEQYEKTMELLIKASLPYDPDAKEEEDEEDEEEILPYYDFEGGNREDVILEAYRKGDLDALDSVQRKSVGTKHYYKYFIEERNEIMAHNMDSIMHMGKSMFTGVGAAHLPAERGIINLLRKKGYTVKPIAFSSRKESKLKAKIEKLTCPVTFSRAWSKDSLFSIDIPGEIHEIASYQEGSHEYFYPDVANGCYYSVKRFSTYGPFFNKSPETYSDKLDSMFFENIPGKMLKKSFVKTAEGYPSWTIINRTRRGDIQKSRIIVTPVNIYFFRVSGTGDYVKGKEADRFLNSVKINENSSGRSVHNNSRNFHLRIPGIVNREGDNRYYGYNPENKTSYSFRYFENGELSFIEEDTFELNILAENFMYSQGFRVRERKINSEKGIHSIVSQHTDKNNRTLYSKMIISGKDYYHLSCDCASRPEANKFFESFRLGKYKYKDNFIDYHDTSLHFTVRIEEPDTAQNERMKQLMSRYMGSYYGIFGYRSKKKNKEDLSYQGESKFNSFHSPSSGETVTVMYQKLHNYTMYKDAEAYWQETFFDRQDSDINGEPVIRHLKKTNSDNDASLSFIASDTGSTRALMAKSIIHGGVQYSIVAVFDTLIGPGKFITTFFETFKPDDTLIGVSPFVDKTKLFVDNLLSNDTSRIKQALASYSYVWEDLSDEQVRKIGAFMLSPECRKLKNELRLSVIEMAGYFEKDALITPLGELFKQAEDTMYMQVAILKSMLNIQSVASVKAFSTLIVSDPPLSEDEYSLGFVRNLRDTIEIAVHAFPALYGLLEYPEYRDDVYALMAELAERGFLKPADYAKYLNRITRDANNSLKRQLSYEEPDVEAYDTGSDYGFDYGFSNAYKHDKSTRISENARKEHLFSANLNLTDLMFLMAPSYNSEHSVKHFFQKVARSKDNTLRMQASLIQLKYNIPVNDTVWNYFMKNDRTRYETFRALHKLGKKVPYDEKYADTSQLAISMLTMGWSHPKTDSARLYKALDVTLRGLEHGRLYVFENEKKEAWSKKGRKELMYILIDMNETDPEKFGSLSSDTRKIPRKKKTEEVFEELMRDMRIYNRKKVRRGYYLKPGSFGYGMGMDYDY